MPTISGVNFEIPDGSISGASISPIAEIAPTQLAQRVMQSTPIKFSDCRVWDAMQSLTPGTPAADDLGLITGTPGTDAPMISTGDLKAAGATTRKMAFELEVPSNYEDGQTIGLRFSAGMETTISDGTATLDVEIYKPNGAGAVGSDLCDTAAQSINSLTPANKDFVIDPTGVDPGDKLICIVSLAVNDAATGTAVTAAIYAMFRRCDTRG